MLCGELGVTGLEILALVGTELVVSLADTSCRSVERSAVHMLVVYVESVLTRISEKKIYSCETLYMHNPCYFSRYLCGPSLAILDTDER